MRPIAWYLDRMTEGTITFAEAVEYNRLLKAQFERDCAEGLLCP